MIKLKLNGVSKAYGATKALSHADLEIEAGEVHVLLGSNGSGKSTLSKIVAGSVRPDAGEILLDGKPVTITGPQSARSHGIAIFYQELSLAAHRTVAENISLASLPSRAGIFVDGDALEERAQRYMALFDGVTGDGFSLDAVIEDLRADQRQLVEIIKALAIEASVIIFDEATSALDRAQVERFFEILRALKQKGRSIIFISHRMDEIFAIGDRATVIRDGQIVGTKRIADTSPSEIITMMVGGHDETDAKAVEHHAPTGAAALALSVKNLGGRGFGDVSFDVRKGEILGFGGLHGQGQSAVLKALFGAAPPTSGSVELDGKPLNPANPRAMIRQGVAYVSGDRAREGVVTGRPILENVMPIHYLRDRMILAHPPASARKALPALQALRTKFAGLGFPISSLSGGNQQKVVIARWLIDRPAVLLLDDPTKGIDLSAKADLFALIRKLAEEGMGIVLYASEDAELLDNADRILVFNGGAVRRELTGTARTRYNLYQAAYEAA
ncbi:sugar ABC transporter ATP-binding protein [Mesorhizobium sp. Root157]|uniref:sugar ABC transporter ATP-binding protein n=1 Tax=Mesorhizobium sp. Root157 TaxID=1736477 RepID=UPI0006F4D97E|nr:sugar ABC transporter ATP-binding protein [Mesorhizobium sp. Root157]KQZ82842.1 sugar ABC transporter ATP-binding protein [Mesorhizobium sp. Root157]